MKLGTKMYFLKIQENLGHPDKQISFFKTNNCKECNQERK